MRGSVNGARSPQSNRNTEYLGWLCLQWDFIRWLEDTRVQSSSHGTSITSGGEIGTVLAKPTKQSCCDCHSSEKSYGTVAWCSGNGALLQPAWLSAQYLHVQVLCGTCGAQRVQKCGVLLQIWGLFIDRASNFTQLTAATPPLATPAS